MHNEILDLINKYKSDDETFTKNSICTLMKLAINSVNHKDWIDAINDFANNDPIRGIHINFMTRRVQTVKIIRTYIPAISLKDAVDAADGRIHITGVANRTTANKIISELSSIGTEAVIIE